MRFVAVIHRRSEGRRLLQHILLFGDPLPVHPARGPPEHVVELDFP
jgi:hypothetical protein